MAQTFTAQDLFTMIPENGYIIVDKSKNLICIYKVEKEKDTLTGEMIDGEGRIHRLFHQVSPTDFEEIDFKELKNTVQKFLEEKINISDLAEEVVDTTPPPLLMDAHDRIKNPDVKSGAKASKGCFKITIPSTDPTADGEKGKPLDLFIR